MAFFSKTLSSLTTPGRAFGAVLARSIGASVTCPSTSVSISDDGRKLKLSCEEGKERRYHGLWLRHNCQCSECFSVTSQMSNVHPSQLTNDLVIQSASLEDDNNVKVNWSSSSEKHSSLFSVQWLKDNDYSNYDEVVKKQQLHEPLIAKTPPVSDYHDIMASDEGTFEWLKQVNHFGISLVKNVPTDNERDVLKFAKKFPHIQDTIYGEMCSTAPPPEASDNNDFVYTTGALHLHQDLNFYELSPGILFLNCHRFDECVEGGESIIMDMYPLGLKLRQEHPKEFETLATVPVTYQRRTMTECEEAYMSVGKTIITTDRFGQISGFHWNTHHIDPLCVQEDKVEDFYTAFTLFSSMIEQNENKFVHRLQPGYCFILNNRRMIHSRNSFKLNGGVRTLTVFYANIDFLQSQFIVLAKKLGRSNEVSKRVFMNSL